MIKKVKIKHAKVDKYQAQANATSEVRKKLFASLPSSSGLPIVERPSKKKVDKVG